MNKAIFLDRDGTINFDYNHVFDPERVTLLNQVAQSIAELKHAGFLIIIITNQSCIGRGFASDDQVSKTNDKICSLLLESDPAAKIDSILIAPDHPENPTNRRKPNPGMILEAKEMFNLDLTACWVIGDRESDPLAGLNAGIPKNQCLLVDCNQIDSSKNESTFSNYHNLSMATEHILKASN